MDEATEIISPTDGKDVGDQHDAFMKAKLSGKFGGIHDDDYIVKANPDNTPIELYTVRELQAILNLGYRGCLQWLAVNVTPLGGCVRVGRRNLYHRWAINEALKKKEWQGLRHKKAGRSISPNRYFQKEHLSKKQSSE